MILNLPLRGNPPKIFVLVPPPTHLMEHGSIGANQTVINNVYSKLIPLIQQANKNVVNLVQSRLPKIKYTFQRERKIKMKPEEKLVTK